MISAVAEMYDAFILRRLRLYEREGLLKPSRTEGNTRGFIPTKIWSGWSSF